MILTPLEGQNIGFKINIRCHLFLKIGLSCDAVKHYKYRFLRKNQFL